MSKERVTRQQPVDIFSVPLSDEEVGANDPAPKRRLNPSKESGQSTLGASSRAAQTPMQLSNVQIHHLLLAKGMVAVYLDSILRRLQRRLSVALRAPTLTSSGRVTIKLDGFEAKALHSRLPNLEEVKRNGRSHFVAWRHQDFRAACLFPFHTLGFREAKLFKPARVREARAICYYSPPIQFSHRRQMIAGVEETCLTVRAQVSMLNHAGVLQVATAPPTPKENEYIAFTGYVEMNRVAIKDRGVELLQQFLADPASTRIPLSVGLQRVATGESDEASEASVDAAEAEAELLEPMPLPGAVDTFDGEDEEFE